MPEERIETRVAVLESRMETMEKMADDVAEIKEMIAHGKGAWWAIATLIAIGGAVEYGIHKLLP